MKPAICRTAGPLPRSGVVVALLGSCLLPASGADAGQPAPWQLQLRSDRHSDFLSLRQLEDEALEQLGSRPGRNLAYIDDEARVSHARGAWTWSVLVRSTATLVVSRDAVDLVRHATGEPPAGSDRRWQVDARLRGFTGAGMDLRRDFELHPQWNASLSAQALSLARWRDRRIDGSVRFDAAQDSYRFDVRSSETYNGLDFPFQRSFASRGTGLLFGAQLNWQADPFSLSLVARDAGWLRWRGIPRQEAVLSTSTEDRDADGFVIYRPLVQGQNSQARRTERWPVRWMLKGSWRASAHGSLGLSAETLPGFGVLPALSWRQRVGALEAGLGWRFHERRASASLAWKGWQLQLGADRLGSGAHSRVVVLGYGAPL